MKTTIYSNGKQLFTLENYGKTVGICHENGIKIYKEVSKLKARSMHSKGALLYVFGYGDTKALKGAKLKKGVKIGNFEIW